MLAMFLVEERRLHRLLYFLAFIGGIGGLLTTLSRGGWITIPVSLPLVFLFAYRRRLAEARTYVSIFLTAVVALALVSVIYPTVERRLQTHDLGAASRRAPLNRAAFSVIKQFPVTGVGLNNLARVFKTYDKTGGSAMFEGTIQVAHNLYLTVWAETGTIGVIAFLWIFLAAFFVAVKYLRKVSPWQRGILVGASCGLLAQLIHGLLDPGFRIHMNVSMLVYTLLGLIGAASIMKNTHPEEREWSEATGSSDDSVMRSARQEPPTIR
jgi:O-antigen ligase